MKYLYKKTGAVVESGIRLNPAIFKPVTEENKNISSETAAAVIAEEATADDVATEECPVENVSATAAVANVLSAKTSAKVSTVQKKTAVKKTASTKR